jgi:hypothetical protein
MTAYFQNGLFHNSRFNDCQKMPYAYGLVRFGNREKKEKEKQATFLSRKKTNYAGGQN